MKTPKAKAIVAENTFIADYIKERDRLLDEQERQLYVKEYNDGKPSKTIPDNI